MLVNRRRRVRRCRTTGYRRNRDKTSLAVATGMCRRPIVAVLLLSGLVGYQKSASVEGVNGCRRSIIAVPPFVRHHQTVAVGYDGRCRRLFENMAGDDDAPVCRTYIAIGLVPCDKSDSGGVEKLTVLSVNYFPSPIRPQIRRKRLALDM